MGMAQQSLGIGGNHQHPTIAKLTVIARMHRTLYCRPAVHAAGPYKAWAGHGRAPVCLYVLHILQQASSFSCQTFGAQAWHGRASASEATTSTPPPSNKRSLPTCTACCTADQQFMVLDTSMGMARQSLSMGGIHQHPLLARGGPETESSLFGVMLSQSESEHQHLRQQSQMMMLEEEEMFEHAGEGTFGHAGKGPLPPPNAAPSCCLVSV